MLHFGTQSIHALVWGQRTVSGNVSDGSGINQNMAVKPWLSMPGQTTGGIGFYREETGQPLYLSASGAYVLDTYLTSYAYVEGQYSFALEIHLDLAEALNLADNQTNSAVYGLSLAEALSLSGADGTYNALTYALADAVGFSDTYAFNCIYGVGLSESLTLHDALITNAELIAYVMNLSTSAMSTYSNFNFNSFAKIGTKYYGATDDGIYELTGDTDAGVAIEASVKLGTEDFGVPKLMQSDTMKRVQVAYLGLKSDGTVLLNVTANGATNSYALTATSQTSLHTGRLKLGNGVASRYWDFEITNVDGASLELESVTFYPVELNRRIVEN